MQDSQSIKTSPQGGPRGFDEGKKVHGRKRCLLVDVLGLLLAMLVLPADVQDRDTATLVAGSSEWINRFHSSGVGAAGRGASQEYEKSIIALHEVLPGQRFENTIGLAGDMRRGQYDRVQ